MNQSLVPGVCCCYIGQQQRPWKYGGRLNTEAKIYKDHLPSEKHTLESWEKTAFSMAKKKSNLHHNAVPGSGLVAEGYGQRVNSNVEEKDLTPGKDHHNGD